MVDSHKVNFNFWLGEYSISDLESCFRVEVWFSKRFFSVEDGKGLDIGLGRRVTHLSLHTKIIYKLAHSTSGLCVTSQTDEYIYRRCIVGSVCIEFMIAVRSKRCLGGLVHHNQNTH